MSLRHRLCSLIVAEADRGHEAHLCADLAQVNVAKNRIGAMIRLYQCAANIEYHSDADSISVLLWLVDCIVCGARMEFALRVLSERTRCLEAAE